MSNKLSLSALSLKLKTISDESRIRILNLLQMGELNVTSLTHILGQSQPRISRHLKILCEAEILVKKRDGSNIYFSIQNDSLNKKLLKEIFKQFKKNEPTLAKDIKVLASLKQSQHKSAQKFFDENAANWDSIRSHYIDDSLIESAMSELINNDKIATLVDLGTGTGRMLELYAPSANKAIGIDNNRKMLLIAENKLRQQKLLNCELMNGDINNLSLNDNSVDLTIIHQVLHYFDNPLPPLKEMARITKKNGKVLIVDFASHNYEILRKKYAHQKMGFANETIANILESLNFKMLEYRNLYNLNPDDDANLVISIWYAQKIK